MLAKIARKTKLGKKLSTSIEEIKIIESNEPPISPSAVLFGLIKGKILFLPNKFPNKYAPISISAVFKITKNKRRFPLIGSD